MYINITDLHQYEFQISGINIFRQHRTTPTLRVKKRPASGFLYILSGRCRYSYGEESFELEPGSLVYLPSGSAHLLEQMTEDLIYYRIDFVLTINQEESKFSRTPLLVCKQTPPECEEAIHRLAEKYQYVFDSVAKNELMCTMFRALRKNAISPRARKLYPAVRHLSRNLTSKVTIEELAELCYMSKSWFYELFQKEYGMTPMEYRDSLLMEKACALLRSEELSVTEIAEQLGFENVSYFSKFFRKYQGISPSQYIKSR